MEKRNNHYIPQFYLKGFLDQRVIPPREASVWVYDKHQGVLKQRGIHKVASLKGFYDLKLVTGEITTVIEDYFSKYIETPSSVILKKIINQIPINDDERIEFSYFIYFTLARVPNFLNYMSWFYKNSDKLNLNPKSYNNTRKLVEENHLPDGLTTLETMIEMSKIFVPKIYDMSWQFHIAPQNKYFLTSDNPVILNDPNSKKVYPSFSGWNNPNIHLTFPLDSTMCLRATWGNKRKTYVKASPRFIRAINFRTSFFSTRYIFSPRPIESPSLDGHFIYNKI
ncbi:DUF4238 domain-containing protein [Paenibacillus sp. OK003]|uniref:DUF4238 domain-containing protein n=1 Tax=Paenibacillus sp. OK003 TaxID=1884380 RepID=UPI0008AED341|nr:DUF4238 domain-containing protein [Paenibacillus sp. OK003]SEL31537.1 Protein of unknown function [Paenibacillus sp. OK003]